MQKHEKHLLMWGNGFFKKIFGSNLNFGESSAGKLTMCETQMGGNFFGGKLLVENFGGNLLEEKCYGNHPQLLQAKQRRWQGPALVRTCSAW